MRRVVLGAAVFYHMRGARRAPAPRAVGSHLHTPRWPNAAATTRDSSPSASSQNGNGQTTRLTPSRLARLRRRRGGRASSSGERVPRSSGWAVWTCWSAKSRSSANPGARRMRPQPHLAQDVGGISG